MNQQENITISAAIIVRDGEKHLRRCLESLTTLVSEFVIGIDDRTVDGTETIARKFTDRIYYFSWEGFAAARNFLLPYIKTDWWIYLDHEEWLEQADIPLIRKLLQDQGGKSEELSEIAAYQLSEKPDGCALCQTPRIFRTGSVIFEGIKHNQPKSSGKSDLKPIRIYHKGYDLSPEEMAAKHKRDEELLLRQKAEKPGNISILRNLIRLYQAQKRYDDVINMAKPIWDCKAAGKSTQMIGTDLLSAYLAKEEYEKAEKVGLKLLKLCPDAIDGWYQMGILYHLQGEWQNCVDAFTKYLSYLHRLKQHPHFVPGIVDSWGSEWKAYELMAISCYELHQHWEAVDNFRASVKKAKNWKKQHEYMQIALAAVAPGDPLNILFVQPKPCPRNRKTALALQKKGHKVTLAYMTDSNYDEYIVGDIYDATYRVTTQAELLELCRSHDITHVHNEPDTPSLIVSEYAPDVVLVHDTHDMIQLRHPNSGLGPVAAIANRRADGAIFSTPQQFLATKQFYDIDTSKSIVIFNFVSEDDLPQGNKPKLSESDGLTHIVYEGSLMGMHRELKDAFMILGDMGYCMHIHPAFENPEYEEMAWAHERIYYNHPLPPERLLAELTQYDIGIIPWNVEASQKPFLDTCLANKLFEYSAAGLPVIARRTAALEWMMTEQNLGLVYDDISEIPEKIGELKAKDVTPKTFTMESQINTLIGFYRMLIREKQQLRQKFLNFVPDGIRQANLVEFETQELSRNERPVEYAFVLKWLAKCSPRVVLDVGPGRTALPSLLRTCGYKVAAIDNWTDYWKEPIFNRHWYIIEDDIQHPEKLDGQKFDFITCVSTLEHVEDPNAAISSMFGLLNPGGYIALTVPWNEEKYIDNIYDDPMCGYDEDRYYKCKVFDRQALEMWLIENQGELINQEYWNIFAEGLWTVGKRLFPPRQTTAFGKHDLACILLQKRG